MLVMRYKLANTSVRFACKFFLTCIHQRVVRVGDGVRKFLRSSEKTSTLVDLNPQPVAAPTTLIKRCKIGG